MSCAWCVLACILVGAAATSTTAVPAPQHEPANGQLFVLVTSDASFYVVSRGGGSDSVWTGALPAACDILVQCQAVPGATGESEQAACAHALQRLAAHHQPTPHANRTPHLTCDAPDSTRCNADAAVTALTAFWEQQARGFVLSVGSRRATVLRCVAALPSDVVPIRAYHESSRSSSSSNNNIQLRSLPLVQVFARQEEWLSDDSANVTSYGALSLRSLLSSAASVYLLLLGLLLGAAISIQACVVSAKLGGFKQVLPQTPATPEAASSSGEQEPQPEKQQEAEDEEKEEEEEEEEGGDGVLVVGHLVVDTRKVVGYEPHGTVVFEGVLNDGRQVSVKRLARCEYDEHVRGGVADIVGCGEHENVVRHYRVEHDKAHVYLAATLCRQSLAEWLQTHRPQQPPVLTCELVTAMHDVAEGLKHLHDKGVVHGRLCPRCVLCDASGHLRISHTSFTSAASSTSGAQSSEEGACACIDSCESTGWAAPEVLRGDAAVGPAADVFSVGCMFYLVATGFHAFGAAAEERDARVLAGQADVSALWCQPVAQSLVQRMLDARPERRPSARAVCRHPLFWSPRQRLAFLVAASDKLETEKATPLAANYDAVLGALGETQQWNVHCHQGLLDDLSSHKRYNYSSAANLLRVIRNKSAHYYDLPPHLRSTLGEYPDGFLAYFERRFPSLFICTFEFLRHAAARDPTLVEYF